MVPFIIYTPYLIFAYKMARLLSYAFTIHIIFVDGLLKSEDIYRHEISKVVNENTPLTLQINVKDTSSVPFDKSKQ